MGRNKNKKSAAKKAKAAAQNNNSSSGSAPAPKSTTTKLLEKAFGHTSISDPLSDPTPSGCAPVPKSTTTKLLEKAFGKTPMPEAVPDAALAFHDTEQWKKDVRDLTDSWENDSALSMGDAEPEIKPITAGPTVKGKEPYKPKGKKICGMEGSTGWDFAAKGEPEIPSTARITGVIPDLDANLGSCNAIPDLEVTLGLNAEEPSRFAGLPPDPDDIGVIPLNPDGVHLVDEEKPPDSKGEQPIGHKDPHAEPDEEHADAQSSSDEPLMATRGPRGKTYQQIGQRRSGPSVPQGNTNTVTNAANVIRQMFHRAIAAEVSAGNMEPGSDRERELLEVCEVCIANGWTVDELKARMLQNVPEEFREEMEGFVRMLMQLGTVDPNDFGLGKESRKREDI